MKRLLIFFFALFVLHSGQAQEVIINNFQVDIYLNEKGYFDVVEKYDLNLLDPKMGMRRRITSNIDLYNSKGSNEKRRVKIRSVEVPGRTFTTKPSYFAEKTKNNLEVLIQEKEELAVDENHEFELRYRVYEAFVFGDRSQRLTWDIKSAYCDELFYNIEFRIHPPEDTDIEDIDFLVFSGKEKFSNADNQFVAVKENGIYKAVNKEGFRSRFGESVTVVVDMPVGAVDRQTEFHIFWYERGWLLILGLVLLILIVQWYRYKKNEKTISDNTYLPPNDIDPAMAGFLIDKLENNVDLISLIPYWAAQGILKIVPSNGGENSDKSYVKLVQLKAFPSDKPKYEKEFFKGLFKTLDLDENIFVAMSHLDTHFNSSLSKSREELKKAAQIYSNSKSEKLYKNFIASALILGVVLFVLFLYVWGWSSSWGLALFFGFILLTGFVLVRKNKKGREKFSELKGFREFIRVADINKLQSLMKEDSHYFEGTLAYAYVFGLLNGWTFGFKTLDVSAPSWYEASSKFNGLLDFRKSFSSTMDSIWESIQKHIESNPK